MTENTETEAPKALDDTSSGVAFATNEDALEAMKKDFTDLARRRARAARNAAANDAARRAKEMARRRKADKAAKKARKASRKRRRRAA